MSRRWRTLPATTLQYIVKEFVGEGDAFGVGQPRENEKKEERKGGVPRRDGEICTVFGMKRTRN